MTPKTLSKKSTSKLGQLFAVKSQITAFISLFRIRKSHQVCELEESKDLKKAAQKWAEKLAKQDKAENGNENDQGECLFSYRFVISCQYSENFR